MIGLLGYFAVCLGAIVIYLQINNTILINRAERNMTVSMLVFFHRQELEKLRDDLLVLKARAIEAGYQEMERFYEIEHKMNLLAEKLDRIERQLIAQGLQQPSNKGRLEYMLKLVNLSLATN